VQVAGGAALTGSIWAGGEILALFVGPFCPAVFIPFFTLAVRPSFIVLYTSAEQVNVLHYR